MYMFPFIISAKDGTAGFEIESVYYQCIEALNFQFE